MNSDNDGRWFLRASIHQWRVVLFHFPIQGEIQLARMCCWGINRKSLAKRCTELRKHANKVSPKFFFRFEPLPTQSFTLSQGIG